MGWALLIATIGCFAISGWLTNRRNEWRETVSRLCLYKNPAAMSKINLLGVAAAVFYVLGAASSIALGALLGHFIRGGFQ